LMRMICCSVLLWKMVVVKAVDQRTMRMGHKMVFDMVVLIGMLLLPLSLLK